jgi:transcription antitermination factor NusG
MSSSFKPVAEREILARKRCIPNRKFSWFVFYTCPRSEKVVFHELINREYNAFLPLTKTLKIWKNRQKKWIDQVLFPGYIFVYTSQCELHYITQIPKIVTYIHCAGKPSVISSNEIEGIRKILDLEQNISVETKFYKGERVKIVCGPLVGHEGILVKQNGKTRFGIQLEKINHIVLIDIDINVLEKV